MQQTAPADRTADGKTDGEADSENVFGLITPEDWFRIPLVPEEQREASVSALIKRQFAGVDDQPVLRRRAEEQLRGPRRPASSRAESCSTCRSWKRRASRSPRPC